jgi:hypothetical protein
MQNKQLKKFNKADLEKLNMPAIAGEIITT